MCVAFSLCLSGSMLVCNWTTSLLVVHLSLTLVRNLAKRMVSLFLTSSICTVTTTTHTSAMKKKMVNQRRACQAVS